MTTRVYRVEKNGCGPYTYTDTFKTNAKERKILKRLNDSHDSDYDNHPAIDTDFVNCGSDFLCGCLTLKQLKKWFRGHLTPLKRIGFKIKVHKVDPKKQELTKSISGKQVIFVPLDKC